MAGISYNIYVNTNLDCTNVEPITIGVPIQKGDSRAHVIRVKLSKDGKVYNPPTGYSVIGYFQTKSATKPYSSKGVISGNMCSVEFPSNVYKSTGEVVAIIRLVATNSGTPVPTVTIAKAYMFVIHDVDQSGANTPTSEWTVSQVSGYIDRLVTNVNTFNTIRSNLESRMTQLENSFAVPTEQAVNNWLNAHFSDDEWRLTDNDRSEIADIVSENINSDINSHIANDGIHVSALDRVNWDGKQDEIADLETIRSGAAAGATALQTHQDISGKQDVLTPSGGITISGNTISAKKIVTAFKSGLTATKSAHTDVTWEYGYEFSDIPFIFVTPSATPKESTSRCIYNGNISVSVYAVTTTSCKVSIYNNSSSTNVSMGLALMAVG